MLGSIHFEALSVELRRIIYSMTLGPTQNLTEGGLRAWHQQAWLLRRVCVLTCSELDLRECVFEFRDFWTLQTILAGTNKFPYVFKVSITCGGRITRSGWVPRFPGIGLASRMHNVEQVTIAVRHFTLTDVDRQRACPGVAALSSLRNFGILTIVFVRGDVTPAAGPVYTYQDFNDALDMGSRLSGGLAPDKVQIAFGINSD